jgi:hypothetical protein
VKPNHTLSTSPQPPDPSSPKARERHLIRTLLCELIDACQRLSSEPQASEETRHGQQEGLEMHEPVKEHGGEPG